MRRIHDPYLTRQLYGKRPTQYLLAVIIAVLTYTFTALIVDPSQFMQHLSITYLLAYSILAIIVVEGNRWIAQFLDKRIYWYDQPVKRLAIQSVLTLIWVSLVLGVPTYLYIIFNLQLEYDYLLFLILAVTFGSILLISIHIGRNFFFNWQYSLIQNERLKQEKIQHDYEMLQNQLNPHFLFNNLNVLIAQIRTDQDKAVLFVEHFSEIYRYVLQNKNTKLVSLKDELEFLDSYRYLLQIRFGKNLIVNVDVPHNYLSYKLPPLTLQILMENAVKHNVISDQSPLHIDINAKEQFLIIRNNLRPKKGVQTSTHLGLTTIKERYAYFTEQPVKIEEKSNYFIVTVPLLKDEYGQSRREK